MSRERAYLYAALSITCFLVGYLVGGGRVQWVIVFCVSFAVSSLYQSSKSRDQDATRR